MRSCLAWTDANAMIWSETPAPLSNNKNWSPLAVVWYSIGRTGIAVTFKGSASKFLSWRAEWIFRWRFFTVELIAAPSDIPASCLANIYWFVVTVSVARCFILALIFATSQLVWLCGCVCVLIRLFNRIIIWIKIYSGFAMLFYS